VYPTSRPELLDEDNQVRNKYKRYYLARKKIR
jgi:hypothetical protein